MAGLIALLGALFVVFLVMIGIIFTSGTIEGRRRPRDQDRPDARPHAQPGPDVRTGQF